jgi:hypothetical protein
MAQTKNDPLHVTGWSVHSTGDSSVGIPFVTWQIDGDMFFDDLEHKEAFRDSLKAAFELVCDGNPGVVSYEEERAIIDMEDKMMERPDE